MSYELAEILIKNILARESAYFFGFLREAKVADAGNQAAIDWLGADLAFWAGEFLGPGDWAPGQAGSNMPPS